MAAFLLCSKTQSAALSSSNYVSGHQQTSFFGLKKKSFSQQLVHKRFSRQGSISLSINFLVVLILAIIVLGLGFSLLKKMVSGSSENLASMREQFDRQVDKVLQSSNVPVYISPEEQSIDGGKGAVFVVGIRNLKGAEAAFSVGQGNCKAYALEDKSLLAPEDSCDRLAISFSPSLASEITLQSNEIGKVAVVINTKQGNVVAKEGFYTLDIEVLADGNLYDKQKLYLKVH
ncbi:MAG: hypothetical protein QW594_02230 [Candidatus Woesearchaeota archaeon]